MTVRPSRECVRQLQLTPTHFCAKSQEGSSCAGDSGGPAVINNQLAGIISYGTRSCNPRMGIAYTRVYDYIDWIRRKISI